jgi:hypothetical protein
MPFQVWPREAGGSDGPWRPDQRGAVSRHGCWTTIEFVHYTVADRLKVIHAMPHVDIASPELSLAATANVARLPRSSRPSPNVPPMPDVFSPTWNRVRAMTHRGREFPVSTSPNAWLVTHLVSTNQPLIREG